MNKPRPLTKTSLRRRHGGFLFFEEEVMPKYPKELKVALELAEKISHGEKMKWTVTTPNTLIYSPEGYDTQAFIKYKLTLDRERALLVPDDASIEEAVCQMFYRYDTTTLLKFIKRSHTTYANPISLRGYANDDFADPVMVIDNWADTRMLMIMDRLVEKIEKGIEQGLIGKKEHLKD